MSRPFSLEKEIMKCLKGWKGGDITQEQLDCVVIAVLHYFEWLVMDESIRRKKARPKKKKITELA